MTKKRKYQPTSPTPEAISHFSSTPWASALFSDPTLLPFNNGLRVKKGFSGNTFFSRTLATSDTIVACQNFVRLPPSLSSNSSSLSSKSGGDEAPDRSQSSASASDTPLSSSEVAKAGEIITIVTLGTGLNGHPDTLHGGFISLLLDEVIGLAAVCERPVDKSTMTRYLKVDYLKPIGTPGVVLCRSWVKKEGRKIWGVGAVEDGRGNVLAIGEALFLVVERIGGGGSKL